MSSLHHKSEAGCTENHQKFIGRWTKNWQPLEIWNFTLSRNFTLGLRLFNHQKVYDAKPTVQSHEASAFSFLGCHDNQSTRPATFRNHFQKYPPSSCNRHEFERTCSWQSFPLYFIQWIGFKGQFTGNPSFFHRKIMENHGTSIFA